MIALFGATNIYVVFKWGAILVNSAYIDITKWQMLLIQLMPSIFFVIMIIITLTLYPKSNKKSCMMLLLISLFSALCSVTPDWIGAYNVINILPNGSRFIQNLEIFYWY